VVPDLGEGEGDGTAQAGWTEGSTPCAGHADKVDAALTGQQQDLTHVMKSLRERSECQRAPRNQKSPSGFQDVVDKDYRATSDSLPMTSNPLLTSERCVDLLRVSSARC